MAVKHKVIEQHDSVTLNNIIRVLEAIEQQQPKNLVDTERTKLCEKIVSNLGRIAIPSNADDYVAFMSQISKIQEVLIKTLSTQDMVVATLHAMFKEISNPQRQPTPTMSIVLHLIDQEHIPNAVKYILHLGLPEANLERSLLTLCNWLSKWTWTPNLGPLVLEYMKGLEAEQYDEILIEVTLTYVERLFKLLILPDVRVSLGPVVLHMLSRMQQSPDAFQKVEPHVKGILESLCRENSESSHIYLQSIVKLCYALMEHFPGYTSYEQLRQILLPYNLVALNDYKELVNCKSWINTSSNSVPAQLTPGKVGLNNLGNTCYMNSVLQALFMTKLFRNDILSTRDVLPLFAKLQTLFGLLQFSERSAISPTEISTIAKPPGFQPGHQHDSSEFLGYLLDMLHEQEKAAINNCTDPEDPRPSLTLTPTPGPSSLHLSEQASTSTSLGVNTVVKRSFGGRTTTSSRCHACGACSNRVDAFRDLPLSFPAAPGTVGGGEGRRYAGCFGYKKGGDASAMRGRNGSVVNGSGGTVAHGDNGDNAAMAQGGVTPGSSSTTIFSGGGLSGGTSAPNDPQTNFYFGRGDSQSVGDGNDDQVVPVALPSTSFQSPSEASEAEGHPVEEEVVHYSVQQLVDYYLQPERLCGDNQYHCDRCARLTDGERVTEVAEAPARLVLTLKQFRYDPATQLRTKILQRVHLDDDIRLGDVNYHLYAAIVHCGTSVDSGHYYTYAKDCDAPASFAATPLSGHAQPTGGDWYKFNDCYVMRSTAEELRGLRSPEAPYILFYRRVDCPDPPALRRTQLSQRLQVLVEKDRVQLEREKKTNRDTRRTGGMMTRSRSRKEDDDPPPSCGGGGLFGDQTHNRFVC